MTGIVRGYEVGKNRNGTQDVLKLQCEVSGPNDIQTVEYMSHAGDDHIPVEGSIVTILQAGRAWKIAVASNDGVDFDATLNEGERKLYALGGAFIKLADDGTIELNGNARNAARQDDATVINSTTDSVFITWISLVSAFINGLAPGTIPTVPSTVTGKVNDGASEVKLP